jgi:hypothetical protein
MTISPEYRAKLSAAKRGRVYTAEHRAAIAAGMRKAHATKAFGFGVHSMRAKLAGAELADYDTFRSAGYRVAEALTAIGRSDLIP